MNSTISYTDTGAILGKTFLRIAQVLLVILALGAGYMAYLANEGLFSNWNIQIDSDLENLVPSIAPESWITYFSIAIALKFLLWVGILAWLERKI